MQILSKDGIQYEYLFQHRVCLSRKSSSQKVLPRIPPPCSVRKSLFIQITSHNDVWTPKAEQQPTRRQTISGRLKTETSPGGNWQRHDRCLWGITLLYVSLLLHHVLIRSQPLCNLNTRKYREKIASRFSPKNNGNLLEGNNGNFNFVKGKTCCSIHHPLSHFLKQYNYTGLPK